jgi:hypothetical protein
MWGEKELREPGEFEFESSRVKSSQAWSGGERMAGQLAGIQILTNGCFRVPPQAQVQAQKK